MNLFLELLAVRKTAVFFILSVLAAFCLQGLRPGDLLAAGKLEAITPEIKAKEPPLTQKDIDLFIKFLKSPIKLDSPKTDNVQADLESHFEKFASANKTSLIHLAYITEKIPKALIYAMDSDAEIHDRLKPNTNESKILMTNKDRIIEAIVEAGS
ncbi:MAG: hypothetical protein LBP22_08940 [Deltaproteobacteria bacterium]|jgi:hypothetical protein|nr:hypothetical protein [Deltaproteobacteria bacterium]